MKSVYIHIPFCERICTYCDFPKRVGTIKQMDAYLDALAQEIQSYQVNHCIDTLYIGGGTPSILKGDQLKKLEAMINMFQLSDNYEMTIECNPEHITADLIERYKSMGINRISLGVQTFQDRLLKLMNRGHHQEQVFQAVDLIRAGGIDNISIDLIFSLPMQTIQNLQHDLDLIEQLNIPHISCYSLILEDKTVLSKWIEDQKVTLLDNEVEAQMFEIVMNRLKKMGYHHYEISNFAKPGFKSKHNQVYWKNQEYFGFGMGASGYLNGIRYRNDHLVTSYIEKINGDQPVVTEQETLSKETIHKEALMLGLRLIDGIEIDEVNRRYDIDVLILFKDELDYLLKQGWIRVDQMIRLTELGLFYGNDVFEQFI